MNKKEERAKALKERMNEDVKSSSLVVLKELESLNILDKYNNIGIYYPIGKEINIMPIMDIYPNKNFYLPKTEDEISFIKYNKNDILIDGPFKTKEPAGDIVLRDSIECFIIPCVAITKDNKRIGYGKGYYDRYLAGYKGLKIGICYKSAGNVDLVADSYDLEVDYKILG